MFCEQCGKEIANESKFCQYCGATIAPQTQEVPTGCNTEQQADNDFDRQEQTDTFSGTVSENEQTAYAPPKSTLKDKIGAIKKPKVIAIVAALVVVILAITIVISSIGSTSYKTKLEKANNEILFAADYAENYATLESKVWYNCIFERESTETDKYTQDDYSYFYDDFNDALSQFYSSEYLAYSMVDTETTVINDLMSELKNPPGKFEDEYQALREMYIAYSDMADLVIGSSNYSYKEFSAALNDAKSSYKNAASNARSYLE